MLVSSGEQYMAQWSSDGCCAEPESSCSISWPRAMRSSLCRAATSSCLAALPASTSAKPRPPANMESRVVEGKAPALARRHSSCGGSQGGDWSSEADLD